MFGYGVPETRLITHDGTISNCVLDIPQNINVTLGNNVITTKAGSVLTYGGSVYITQTITQDRATTISDTLADGVYFVNGSGNGTPILTEQSIFGSGNTLPADGSTYDRFYLTTSTDFWHWSGSEWVHSGLSYPLCMIEILNGVASFAKDSNGNDMIFNGAGYIGHYAFVYPNVKGLKSNGFNEDGSLASNEWTNNSLQILELTSYTHSIMVRIIGVTARNYYQNIADAPNDSTSVQTAYDPDKNQMYYRANGTLNWSDEKGNYINLIDYNYNGTTVTDFTIRQPVRLATTEMLDTVQANINTVDAGAYHQPNEIVTLFDGNLDSGDIQLSDYFDSYEFLLFVYGNDGGNIMYSRMITSYELETVLAIPDGGGYALLQQANGGGYWIINKFANGSTTTLLKFSSDDDIRVYKVIGINRFD